MLLVLITYYSTHSVIVKHILIHIHGSLPTRVRFLDSWAEGCIAKTFEAVFESLFFTLKSALQSSKDSLE